MERPPEDDFQRRQQATHATLNNAGALARRAILRPVLRFVEVISTGKKSDTARIVTLPMSRPGQKNLTMRVLRGA